MSLQRSFTSLQTCHTHTHCMKQVMERCKNVVFDASRFQFLGHHPERATVQQFSWSTWSNQNKGLRSMQDVKKSGSKLRRLLSMQVHIKAFFGASPITSQLRWTRLDVIGLAPLHVNNIETFSELHVTSSVHTHGPSVWGANPHAPKLFY